MHPWRLASQALIDHAEAMAVPLDAPDLPADLRTLHFAAMVCLTGMHIWGSAYLQFGDGEKGMLTKLAERVREDTRDCDDAVTKGLQELERRGGELAAARSHPFKMAGRYFASVTEGVLRLAAAEFLPALPEGLVGLARSRARNSVGVLGEPLTHLVVGPVPLKRVGVEAVVLRA